MTPTTNTPRVIRMLAQARDAFAMAVGVGILVLVASHCSGCGASALSLHYRAATVATVAVDGAHRVAIAETHARLDACGADVACAEAVGHDMAPVGLAVDASRTALSVWVDALELAQAAGEDGDVLGALLVAGARWLALWDPLAAALRSVGLEVPDLPPLVTGLLGGVR